MIKMLATFCVTAAVLMFVPPVFANESRIEPPEACEHALTTAADADPERRGCCSWHGGVCGCAGTRAVCCDGSLSPSCPCSKPVKTTIAASPENAETSDEGTW
jgi:hypothetical protein